MKDQSNVIDTSNPKYENTEDPLKTEIIETIEMKVESFDCDPLALSNDSTVQIKTEWIFGNHSPGLVTLQFHFSLQ